MIRNSRIGESSSTERGMIGCGWNITAPTITTRLPPMTAFEMRIRSGKLANTQRPRYRPNIWNISA
jgi:hypothetical protein